MAGTMLWHDQPVEVAFVAKTLLNGSDEIIDGGRRVGKGRGIGV